LNKYPNAPVTAPLANLPPPATEATPPITAFLTSEATWFGPLMNGPAPALTPADSAPD
jgi:hypothetical protein